MSISALRDIILILQVYYSEVKKTKIYLILLLLIVALGVAKLPGRKPPGAVVAGVSAVQSPEATEFPRSAAAAEPARPTARNLFGKPNTLAAAVLIKDVASGAVIYEKNPHSRLPIASLTKLMTALVAVEYGDLDDQVEISPTDLEVSAFRVNFSPGEKLTVRDLLIAMLVSSANDAAMALSRYASGSTENFVRDMNDEAAVLGMQDTSFTNPIGFDHPKHFSTAADLDKLVTEFVNNPALLEIVQMKQALISTVSGKERRWLTTTNQLLGGRPGVIGLKTGYTSEAKGSLIILMNEPRYYSIVLGSPDRERETNALLDWVEKEFEWTR